LASISLIVRAAAEKAVALVRDELTAVVAMKAAFGRPGASALFRERCACSAGAADRDRCGDQHAPSLADKVEIGKTPPQALNFAELTRRLRQRSRRSRRRFLRRSRRLCTKRPSAVDQGAVIMVRSEFKQIRSPGRANITVVGISRLATFSVKPQV
jgi:hypothetical protein